MKMNDQKEDGLPEVAQGRGRVKPIFIGLAGLVVVIILSMVFHTQKKSSTLNVVEDVYTILSSKHEDVKKKSTQVTESEKTKQVDIKPELTQQQLEIIQQKEQQLQQRLSAPLMLVNSNSPTSSGLQGGIRSTEMTQGGTNTQDGVQGRTRTSDANTQFMQDVSSQNTAIANAELIGPLYSVIAEGSFIHAILEPATNSDLPGYLRAIVSEPNYSEDGSEVLIPRGTRLLGQYKSGMLQGQSRIFVVWTRLITPSGISLNLGSPGVDSLGVSGMGADVVDRHFWQRFGTATLLSLIGTGAANAGVNSTDGENSTSAYRTAMANSFAQSASQNLQQENLIAPTLKTYQGKPIMVFVAKDLHFESVMKKAQSSFKVF